MMTTALPATSSNEEGDEEEETCPVCYEPNPHRPAGDAPTSVACEVCKHAVCAECDSMLTQAGHVQCPMCRAPRRPRALPFSMCQKCRLCSALARLLRLSSGRAWRLWTARDMHPRRNAGPQGAQPLP